jgi:hypothetical protein
MYFLNTTLRGYMLSSLALLLLCASSARGNTNGLLHIQWDKTAQRAGGAKGFVELANGDLLATRTAGAKQSTKIICSKSPDGGKTWRDFSTIDQDATPGSDIGDGHLLELRDRSLLYSYRKNLHGAAATNGPRYEIRVAVSRDGGLSWTAHSTVKAVRAEKNEVRGLWSSALHQRKDGALLCFYDDEDAAWQAGFKRHQWLMMKHWDAPTSTWSDPVIVSRASDPKHLSRDGMPSVVELPDSTLLCALESVRTEKPHVNVVRLVRSSDGGKSWNWQREERQLLYAPAQKEFSAVSPWLSHLENNILLCVFATDEERETPDRPGAPVKTMNRDIKFVCSRDQGRTWTTHAFPVAMETHKTYMPQMIQLRHPRHQGAFLCLYLDTVLGFRCLRGN